MDQYRVLSTPHLVACVGKYPRDLDALMGDKTLSDPLNERERKILQCLSEGLSDQEITDKRGECDGAYAPFAMEIVLGLDGSGGAGDKVIDLRPFGRDGNARHLLVGGADVGFKVPPLLRRDELVRGVEIFPRDTVHDLDADRAAHGQNMRREGIGINRQGDFGLLSQGAHLGRFGMRCHDEVRPVPVEANGDDTREASVPV
jgi:hypothetical protein